MRKRLKSLRKLLGLNQAEMGKKMKLSQTHISSLENGAREITDRIINDVCREFNVSEDWFRTGEGKMFIQPDTFSLDEHAKQSNLSNLEIAIVHGYMELDCTTRKNIVSKFKSIIQQHDNIMPNLSPVDLELEWYRQELEDEKKGQISSASGEQKSS